MGFYSPQTLVADARRHGVTVLGPDVNASLAAPTLEPSQRLPEKGPAKAAGVGGPPPHRDERFREEPTGAARA